MTRELGKPMSHQATASSCPPSTPRHQVTCTHGPRVGRTWKSHVRMGQHMSEWVDTCRTYVEHTLAPARAPTTRCSLHWRAFAMPRLVHPASKTAVPSPFRSAVSKQGRGPVLHRRRAGSRVPRTAVMQNTCQTYVTNMRYTGRSVSISVSTTAYNVSTFLARSVEASKEGSCIIFIKRFASVLPVCVFNMCAATMASVTDRNGPAQHVAHML